MRMLLPNKETTQEECTSRETFSNHVIAASTSKNSSPGSINFSISFGNGHCGSKMSAGSLECWSKPYLQVSLSHLSLYIYIYIIFKISYQHLETTTRDSSL